MNAVKGYYINLDRSTERREKMKQQINELGYSERYGRYRAETSTEEEAEERGLSRSELGLWKSWLGIINLEIKSNRKYSYSYLHILEDDAIIGEQIEQMISKLMKQPKMDLELDILFTEMYVNAQLWIELYPKIEALKKEGDIIINKKFYTGCASSALIPSQSLEHLQYILENEMKHTTILLPLDNMLRKLKEKGSLEIGCTFPFLSCVSIAEIKSSTIQDRLKEKNAIDTTQELNALLRQSLSVMRNKNTSHAIANKILQLSRLHGKEKADSLVNKMLIEAKKLDIFRYKFDPRLSNEPDNGQTRK